MTISEILWRAANEHLWDGNRWATSSLDGETFSCCAIHRAAKDLEAASIAIRFLHELGCDTAGGTEFSEFKFGENKQGARYLWLMFAYEVAKSEGL